MDRRTETIDLLISGFGTFKSEQKHVGSVCGADVKVAFNMSTTDYSTCPSGAPGCVPYAWNVTFCDTEFAIQTLTFYSYALEDIVGNPLLPLTADERKCCLARQLKTASPLFGRFSVKHFEQEAVAESIGV
jgi:hypothetical protein